MDATLRSDSPFRFPLITQRVCCAVDGDQSPDLASNQRSNSSPNVLDGAGACADGCSVTKAASARSASRFVPRTVRDFQTFLPVSGSRPA